jgi:hypothetical protein
MKWFGREPVYFLAFFAVVLKLATGLGLDVSDDQQTWINAALAAFVGVVSAFVLKTGAAAAAILQFAQSLLALFVGFHFDLSAGLQAEIMAAVAAGLALFLHEKVTAPVSLLKIEQATPIHVGTTRRA